MAAHDAPTFNGVYAGVLGSAFSGAPVDATAADAVYTAPAAAALAVATEFDTLLNAAGTVGANAQRSLFAAEIARGFFQGRSLPGATPAPNTAGTYAQVAAAMVAAYSAGVGNLG